MCTIGLILTCTPIFAADHVTLELSDWSAPGMRASGISVEFGLPGAQAGPLIVRVARVDLGARLGVAHRLQIDCAQPVISATAYGCSHAIVRGVFERFGAQTFDASASWLPQSKRLTFSAAPLRVASGSVNLKGELRGSAWTLDVDAGGISLAELRRHWSAELAALIPHDWTAEGQITHVQAKLAGRGSLSEAHVLAEIASVNLANPEGTVATQGLKSTLSADFARIDKGWKIRGDVRGHGGELLYGRMYWNFTGQNLASNFAGIWQDGALNLDSVNIRLGDLIQANARAVLNLRSGAWFRSLDAQIDKLDLGAVPAQTRAGLFLGSVVPQLEGHGQVRGRIFMENGVPVTLDLALDDVALNDRVAGLAIDGLDGHFLWHSAADHHSTPGELTWRGGNFYGLAVGGSHIRFSGDGPDFRLLEAARIPLLDGALRINHLELKRVGGSEQSTDFDGELDPISMPILCKAFGWPSFAGTLAGSIPRLKLSQGELALGGALNAQIFGGHVAISGLSISDAFGARPKLKANVVIERLDLAAVTGAFSFGAITGRLSGQISELQLVGWEPTAFDARLYSTNDDRSKRRISQRAVENISSIGGGHSATAALERGALRFFKEFGYEKLGLSCRLANDVCLLDGVESKAGGYYLVKGGGLPRIDVIGSARRVDWRTLVSSLKELPNSQAVVKE
jgi:hypothetical protein